MSNEPHERRGMGGAVRHHGRAELCGEGLRAAVMPNRVDDRVCNSTVS